MKFPYRRYAAPGPRGDTDSPLIARPLVPVRVKGTSGEAALLGLLDTGSDITLLPSFVAEQVGVTIDADSETTLRGAGGQTVSVVSGVVEFELRQGRAKYHWTTAVAFITGHAVAILGHGGFLEFFTAKFDGERQEVTLTANSKIGR